MLTLVKAVVEGHVHNHHVGLTRLGEMQDLGHVLGDGDLKVGLAKQGAERVGLARSSSTSRAVGGVSGAGRFYWIA